MRRMCKMDARDELAMQSAGWNSLNLLFCLALSAALSASRKTWRMQELALRQGSVRFGPDSVERMGS